MLLKYTGKDSPTVRNGQIYNVVIKCSKRQSAILVIVPPNTVYHYPSPQSLAENWSKP